MKILCYFIKVFNLLQHRAIGMKYHTMHWKQAKSSFFERFRSTVRPQPNWRKVRSWWQILPQHQSKYLGGPESAFLFLKKKVLSLKNLLLKFYEVRSERGRFQLMLILGLLGVYFDAAMVFVTNSQLFFRLAMTILWEKKWSAFFFIAMQCKQSRK